LSTVVPAPPQVQEKTLFPMSAAAVDAVPGATCGAIVTKPPSTMELMFATVTVATPLTSVVIAPTYFEELNSQPQF